MKIDYKLKAFQLRRDGKSYRKIAKDLNVSKGTISYWFKNINWSEDIKKQLEKKAKIVSTERLKRLIALKKIKYANLYEQAKKEAEEYFVKNKNNSLFISGIMLYWGEGDKGFKSGVIKLSNTDPAMIKIFRKFLLEILNCEEARIKGWLLLYPDLNVQECLDYWSNSTGIPHINFTKSIVIKGRHKTNRLVYGVCNIYTISKYLKKKVLTWIDLYKKEF